MTRYFAQNTPRAGLEHMMMSVPGFQKRGGGMMILSRFCYKPEDVDCRYCLHYRRRSCQVRTCPYIAERLKSGAIEYLDLILEYFGHIPHAGLHKRIQAVEHWSGPDQAVLHTVSVHLRSRFADRVWDDAPPGYLAALYLSPQRSDSGNRRSPLFHTIPLISAASYPNPMDLRYRITPSFIPPDGCMT